MTALQHISPTTKILDAYGYDWSWAHVMFLEMPDFHGYAFGSDGLIWSRKRRGRWGGLLDDYHLMSRSLNTGGYYQIGMGSRGPQKVHLLILRAFRGPKPEGMVSRHLNGDRRDNRIVNLRYGTPAENSGDMVAHGRSMRGERSPGARLDRAAVRRVRREVAAGVKQVTLAEELGVSPVTINNIVSEATWKHLGEAV